MEERKTPSMGNDRPATADLFPGLEVANKGRWVEKATKAWHFTKLTWNTPTFWVLFSIGVGLLLWEIDVKTQGSVHTWGTWVYEYLVAEHPVLMWLFGGLCFRILLPKYHRFRMED